MCCCQPCHEEATHCFWSLVLEKILQSIQEYTVISSYELNKTFTAAESDKICMSVWSLELNISETSVFGLLCCSKQ
jgi:hypothetical protein